MVVTLTCEFCGDRTQFDEEGPPVLADEWIHYGSDRDSNEADPSRVRNAKYLSKQQALEEIARRPQTPIFCRKCKQFSSRCFPDPEQYRQTLITAPEPDYDEARFWLLGLWAVATVLLAGAVVCLFQGDIPKFVVAPVLGLGSIVSAVAGVNVYRAESTTPPFDEEFAEEIAVLTGEEMVEAVRSVYACNDAWSDPDSPCMPDDDVIRDELRKRARAKKANSVPRRRRK